MTCSKHYSLSIRTASALHWSFAHILLKEVFCEFDAPSRFHFQVVSGIIVIPGFVGHDVCSRIASMTSCVSNQQAKPPYVTCMACNGLSANLAYMQHHWIDLAICKACGCDSCSSAAA
eukprot:1460168-Amphidinium_carterae.1